MNERERAICARFKRVREALYWSQSAFAERLGITTNQVASIEYQRTPLRYDIAWRLWDKFGVSLTWLHRGLGLPNNADCDFFPLPEASGMSQSSLLSAVGDIIWEESGLQSLTGDKGTRSTVDGDLRKRVVALSDLQYHAEQWFEALPADYVTDLRDSLIQYGGDYVESHPLDDEQSVKARKQAIIWEKLRESNATKRLAAIDVQKNPLTTINESVNFGSVIPTLSKLLERLNAAVSERGKRSELAAFLNVPLAGVSQWLSGKREPGGERTLQLLAWVQAEEAKTKENRGGADNTTTEEDPPTPIIHEKSKRVRKRK